MFTMAFLFTLNFAETTDQKILLEIGSPGRSHAKKKKKKKEKKKKKKKLVHMIMLPQKSQLKT